MRLLLAAAGAVWLGGFAPGAEAQATCEWDKDFRISRDSIGPIATADPIAALRALCPQVRDTVSHWPGIVLSIPGGELLGMQTFHDARDEGHRIDLWYVRGDGSLPEGLSMKSTWGDLARAYGSGHGYHEPPPPGVPDYVSVSFDRYPGLMFFLERLDMSALRYPSAFEPDIDLSTVPDSATIRRVNVRLPRCPVGSDTCSRRDGR